jgi:hypothetical protein
MRADLAGAFSARPSTDVKCACQVVLDSDPSALRFVA